MSASLERRPPQNGAGEAGPATVTRRNGFIVEFVGPSAVGKSTLCRALCQVLTERGCRVSLAVSARPAEQGMPVGPLRAAVLRAAKAAQLVPFRRGVPSSSAGAALLAELPCRSALWQLRYRRYLADLDRRWRAAEDGTGIVLFDQGYLSAAAALAALGPGPDSPDVGPAVTRLPRPNLCVRLDAPRDLLATRLSERLAKQGFMERLFELDPATTLLQVDAFPAVDVAAAEIPTVRVTSTTAECLAKSATRVADMVIELQDADAG